MQRRLLALSIALGGITLAVACGDDDTTTAPVSKIVVFDGTVSGTKENPANTSPGSGTFHITLDTSTNVLTWNVTVSGLTTNINNGHIHGPATTAQNAPVIVSFNPANNQIPGSTFTGFGAANAGTATGSLTLTNAVIAAGVSGDSLKKLLLAGLTYVNIHTTQNGGGEVRGQVVKTP